MTQGSKLCRGWAMTKYRNERKTCKSTVLHFFYRGKNSKGSYGKQTKPITGLSVWIPNDLTSSVSSHNFFFNAAFSCLGGLQCSINWQSSPGGIHDCSDESLYYLRRNGLRKLQAQRNRHSKIMPTKSRSTFVFFFQGIAFIQIRFDMIILQAIRSSVRSHFSSKCCLQLSTFQQLL